MSAGDGGGDAATLLADLPPPLWGGLLRALRRAMDRTARSELPRTLQPFAGWRPDKLAGDKPRAAAAAALAVDPALRELVAEALDDRLAYEASADGDPLTLAADHGEEAAVAALVARGRWDAVAVVAGDAAERRAAQARAGAEERRRRRSTGAEAERRRILADLAEAREERDLQRRRADAADERRRRDLGELDRVKAELAVVRAERERLAAELDDERRRMQGRTARMRRRLDEAQARTRVDHERARAVLGDMEQLTARLRDALAPPPAEGTAETDAGGTPDAGSPAAVPRDVAPAEPGRPCRLPDGVPAESPLAVRSLLKVASLEVYLDGYNVTKDPRGQPNVALEQQRHWLVRLAGGVVARTRRPHVVVFDGTEERPGPAPSARGVRVVYTVGEEIADDRLLALVAGLPTDRPVLVVSSDHEVRDRCAALGANTVPSGAYLAALGA